MPSVAVRILHPPAAPGAGPLTRWLAAARAAVAEAHRSGFHAAGATEVEIVAGPGEGLPFGARLRALVRDLEASAGLVVLGSGAMPLATTADRRKFVEAAASGERRALANNRYSADALAIGRATSLLSVPDLPADNALPRWLDEVGGYHVDDLGRRWRLGVDVDSPLDVALVARWRNLNTVPDTPADLDLRTLTSRIEAVAAVGADRRAELLVAGRTSAAALRWLEVGTASRVRAFVEERGLRAATGLARADGGEPRRPPRSLLGDRLDRDGPAALGVALAELSDGALVDTRVLLAHRLGAGEATWPSAEDRFASDLLIADRIADPWLRALTASAAAASIPILLGGHTLVGPGLRLLFGTSRRVTELA